MTSALDLDPHTGIRPGERWKDALKKANARCEAVICLLSTHWLASRECEVEFRFAENLHKAILCARLEAVPDANITSEWQRCDLFPSHRPTTEVDIADGEDPVVLDRVGLQQLWDGLRNVGIDAEHFRWPPTEDPDRAPYRGWAPLEEADAAVFFGRDAQILRALELLRGMRATGTERLFVVLGPSGAGKSSFLRAGLLPRLGRDGRSFLPMPIVRPERAVLTGEVGLACSLHRLRTKLGLRQPMLGDIKAACQAQHVPLLRDWLDEAREAARGQLLDVAAEPPAPTLVLPVDQAEELYNPDAGSEAPRFLELLASLVSDDAGGSPALIVAVTIRADRYEPLLIAPELAEVQRVLFDDLKPMPPAGYAEVITGPAARATAAGRRLRVEPALVQRLLAESAEGADALPLLALTLERLYRDFGADGDLTLAEYEQMGGLTRVVQAEVDDVLGSDRDARRAKLDVLHDAFIPWLATVDPDTNQPMRRVARWANLPEPSRPLIDALVAKRLMVKDVRDDGPVVEMALESLLRQWHELAGWLREEAQDLKVAARLERAADDWRSSDRGESWLLRGARLADAAELAARPRFHDRLAPAAEFLRASHQHEAQHEADEQRRRDELHQAELRAAQERERAAQDKQAAAEDYARAQRRSSRKLRAVLAVMVVIAVIAGGLAVYARINGKRAERNFEVATAQKLIAQAQGMLAGTEPGGAARAFQQILAARHLAPGDGPLYTAVVEGAPTDKIIAGHADPVLAVAYSPDGKRLASAANDGTTRVWDANTGQPVAELTGEGPTVLSLAYSPDGRHIASGDDEGAVRLWDADTGQPVADLRNGHAGAVMRVTFSPDGTRIAASGADDAVQVWDTSRLDHPPLTLHTSPAGAAMAFSPNGHVLATGTADGVQLWNADDGRSLGEPLLDTDSAVMAVAFSPDGRLLATADGVGTILLWNPDTRAQVATLKGHTAWVGSVVFSPDGRRLASAGGDNTVRLWDPDTHAQIGDPIRGHRGPVYDVAFSPDGHHLATASFDKTVRVWNVDAIVPLVGHDDPVVGLAFRPNGRLLATAGAAARHPLGPRDPRADQDIRRPRRPSVGRGVQLGRHAPRQLRPRRHRHTLEPRHRRAGSEPSDGHAPVLSVAFNPDGALLAGFGEDGSVRLGTREPAHSYASSPPAPAVSFAATWTSAPTGGGSRRAAMTAPYGCGTPSPANPSSTSPPATSGACAAWRSAPTAASWSPAAETPPRGSGIPTPADPTAEPWKGTPPTWKPPPTVLTATIWPPPATTVRCGSGTPTPVHRTGPRSKATKTCRSDGPPCCTTWHSAPTGRCWPPPARTGRCGSGPPLPASRCCATSSPPT